MHTSQPPSLNGSFLAFARDIKLQHSIFAIPFACCGFLLMSNPVSLTVYQFTLLLLAMVSARSFAMGFNRLVDSSIDRKNPRTKDRLIARGDLSRHHAAFWITVFAATFVGTSFALNPLAGALSIPLVAIFAIYSFAKRFTWAAHFILGLCLALSPLAVEIALSANVSFANILLSTGILFWVAGFDTLYSLQDFEFDKTQGLFSLPSKIGIRASVKISQISFSLAALSWVILGLTTPLGVIYFVGLLPVIGLLIWQQIHINNILASGDTKLKIEKIFFDSNALVSVIFFISLAIDKWT